MQDSSDKGVKSFRLRERIAIDPIGGIRGPGIEMSVVTDIKGDLAQAVRDGKIPAEGAAREQRTRDEAALLAKIRAESEMHEDREYPDV